MEKTTSRVRDLVALSAKVPWGTRGFGVLMLIYFDAVARPFFEVVYDCVARPDPASTNPAAGPNSVRFSANLPAAALAPRGPTGWGLRAKFTSAERRGVRRCLLQNRSTREQADESQKPFPPPR
jgi:hypothetical protein